MDTNQDKKVRSIVILGGGTAGWITAAKLARQLNLKPGSEYQVTLVESPDIPIIGVGEGTWPTMRKTLSELGIDEAEFIRECGATFKQGTRFVNWKREPDQVDNHYYHLFSSIYDPADFNLAPYWQSGVAGDQISYADAVSAQGEVCKRGLAPKQITTPQYDGIMSYAYHLDAGKFSKFLAHFAVEKLGVKHIYANLQSVDFDTYGDISGLVLDTGDTIYGDLFVDCSGFRSLLLGDALGVGFKPVDDVLLTDSAIAIQIPYDEKDASIPCLTSSTAQRAGWIWDISLQDRRGTGHVYSSAHMSEDEAEATLRSYLGERGRDLDARSLKMSIGYRERFWHRNCVAIGLSAAFVEPLEASAIFLVEAAANMLSEMLPDNRKSMGYVQKTFNDSFRFRWQKTIDFIKLHYVLSERQGSFWIDNRKPETIPESLAEQLAYWQLHGVSKYQFDSAFEPFPQESYQYVLYGMRERAVSRKLAMLPRVEEAKARFQRVEKITEAVVRELLPHRELINKVIRYGIPKV